MGKRRDNVVIGFDPDEVKPTPPEEEPADALGDGGEEVSEALSAPEEEKQLPAGPVYKKIKHPQGKKYLAAKSRVDPGRAYPLEQAAALVKETSPASFDAAVEAHFTLGVDVEDQSQRIRTSLVLPNGTGKEVKVLVFADAKVAGADLMGDDELINALSQGTKKPGDGFDIVVATPSWMPKLAKLGPVLGPAGLLPSPKTGTVSDNPDKVVANLKKGQIEIKCEQNNPLIHIVVGKVSFDQPALVDNIKAVIEALQSARPPKVNPQNFINKLTLTSTMGPGVKVAL